MTTTDAFEAGFAELVARARAAWARPSRARWLTTVVLATLIAGGVVLRLWNVGFPAQMTFDENHFVLTARGYLDGSEDWNNHPPLGKLAIAVGMLALGDDSVGWRAASVVWGLQTIVVAAMLARALFDDRRAAWMAAAFVAADGFFLSYSRTALLDGGLACLVLWSVLAAACARSWRGVLLSAVLVGLAASVKWSGGFVVLPAAATVLARGRVRRAAVPWFAAAPLAHFAVWTGALALTHHAADPRALVAVMRHALQTHLDNANLPHAIASRWYSWLVFYRPIIIKSADRGAWHHYASCVGHPLLFLGAALAVVGALAGALAAAASRRARAWVRARGGDFVTPTVLLALAWIALIAPWTGSRSYTFVYHYLPSYAFALTLFAGLVARLERRFPSGVAFFVCAVFAVAVFYAPVWAELPVDARGASARLMFPTWRP
jgi:dolichyl-phosphate-mannose-protein mannosyltransferase